MCLLPCNHFSDIKYVNNLKKCVGESIVIDVCRGKVTVVYHQLSRDMVSLVYCLPGTA